MKPHALLLAALLALPTAASASDVRAIVTAKARAHGVPVTLAHAITQQETGYNCRAVGSAGELGAMQVKPATARGVGVHGNLRDCATGIEAGMRYLRQALTKAGGSWTGAAALYQGGLYSGRRSSPYARQVLRRCGTRVAFNGIQA